MPSACLKHTHFQKTFRLQADIYVYYHSRMYLRDAIICPTLWPFILLAPCEYQNLADYADAVTVGITQDSIVFCKEQTKTCCRCSPCDEGKTVQEIQFSKITDVNIVEPAGGCCPPEMLFRVYIQTAGRSGVDGAELTIVGLSEKDAYELRSLVKGKRGLKSEGMDRV